MRPSADTRSTHAAGSTRLPIGSRTASAVLGLAASIGLALAAFAAAPLPAPVHAQSPRAPGVAEPFKVGTFEIGGEPTVALVLRDALVVDIGAANRTLERDPAYPPLPMPADMLDLIGRYEYGVRIPPLRDRQPALGDRRHRRGGIRRRRAGGVHSRRGRGAHLPPILYPGKILNAAVNFYSHVNETGTPQERAEARRQRRENRGRPLPVSETQPGRGDRRRRPGGDSLGPRPHRLGGRARRGDRQDRQVRFGGRRAGPRLRLHRHDRHLGPGRAPARRQPPHVGLVRGQGTRHLRADGALDRAEGVLRRPHGESAPDAQRGRRADAGGAGPAT